MRTITAILAFTLAFLLASCGTGPGPFGSGGQCTAGETQPCYTGPMDTEGVGVCTAGSRMCDDGEWQACTGEVLPDDEVCDGVDNDCDPLTLDGAAETALGEACDGADSDLCAEGALFCDGARGLACSDDAAEHDLELCNDVDDDCDPATPDGADEAGINTLCDGPDPDRCRDGVMYCAGPDGMRCNEENNGVVLDVCNGVDDDCDPATVDGAHEAVIGELCDGPDDDSCAEGVFFCDGVNGVACSDEPFDHDLDLCNGKDDDCDPTTADGAHEPTLDLPCDGLDSDLCAEGIYLCAGVMGLVCSDDPNEHDIDLCNGLDDDCNLASMDGAHEDSLGDACDGDDDDFCLGGVLYCTGTGGMACSDDPVAHTEVCGNGIDDDCNGSADDECCDTVVCAGDADCTDVATGGACVDALGDCERTACLGASSTVTERQACADTEAGPTWGPGQPCQATVCLHEDGTDVGPAAAQRVGDHCYASVDEALETVSIRYSFNTTSAGPTAFNLWMRNVVDASWDGGLEQYTCSLTGVTGVGTYGFNFAEEDLEAQTRHGTGCGNITFTSQYCWMAADGDADAANGYQPIVLETGLHELTCSIELSDVGGGTEDAGFDGLIFSTDLSFVPMEVDGPVACDDSDREFTEDCGETTNWGPPSVPAVVLGSCVEDEPESAGTACGAAVLEPTCNPDACDAVGSCTDTPHAPDGALCSDNGGDTCCTGQCIVGPGGPGSC